MDRSESVSGTSDGGALARAVAARLNEADSRILLDFDQIINVSNSAACAFWSSLLRTGGPGVADRVAFRTANPVVLRSLEYGLEYARSQRTTPAQPARS